MSPHPDTPPPVLLAGATGLVGRALLSQLLDAGHRPVHVLLRRTPQQPLRDGARAHVVDYAALPSLPAAPWALCAIGTTMAQAGSEAAFRAADHDAVLAFAKAARAAGTTRFGVVSALGADPHSRTFYNRVKGEVEQALRALGFEYLVIARPSLLDGAREGLGQPTRPAEALALALTRPVARWLPRAWRPVQPAQVARALRQAMRDAPRGVHGIASADMHRKEN